MSTKARQIQLLKSALGSDLLSLLAMPRITEVMVNSDGRVWKEAAGIRELQEISLGAAIAERIIRAVAGIAGQEITSTMPIISAELPLAGERFEGLLPPAVTAPCFVIRKPSPVVFSLRDFVDQSVITHHQRWLLQSAIKDRLSILIAGGTASGKTTFANALMAEIGADTDRLILIEDTSELQSRASDSLKLKTVPGHLSMSDLVRSS